MNTLTCPECTRPLAAEAVADGWCPECGKPIPEFVRAQARRPAQPPPHSSSKPREPRWFPLILLLIAALTGGVMFGMAKHGHLTGPWVAIPVVIYVALAVGRIVELRWRRRQRAATDVPSGEADAGRPDEPA